ncbi:MAG: HD domain-containing protein [Bacteroidales bacterium]|nr:HD domain-containing protein [Bacteroidales bacterium]
MRKERYLEILSYVGDMIRGTKWEGNVLAVGGCVRDDIMDLEIKDIDFCVTLENGGCDFALWLYGKALTLGKPLLFRDFGTAKLHLAAFEDTELEFVQTRREYYPDRSSRNPGTTFGTLAQDCFRRDLTINSLYRNISTGEILDLTGKGLEDISNHVIRTTRDPDPVFDEDPLRILRCIRFASRFGWEIEKGTFSAMTRQVPRMAILTKDRIADELTGMLCGAHPVMAMELLRTSGALHYVLPCLEETVGMTQNFYHFGTVWEHTMAVLGNMSDNSPQMRLAALLHDAGKPSCRTVDAEGTVHFKGHEAAGAVIAEGIMKSFHMDEQSIGLVSFLIRYHMAIKKCGTDARALSDAGLRRIQYLSRTPERFRQLLALIDADNRAHAEGHRLPGQTEAVLRRSNLMQEAGTAMFGYKLPLSGRDIMEKKSLEPGPKVREYLDASLEEAFANPLLTKEELLANIH